jgi:hypothetical protein
MFSESLKSEIPSICSFFEAALLRNKLFHSYLFCGSAEEIKDTFAKELIQFEIAGEIQFSGFLYLSGSFGT